MNYDMLIKTNSHCDFFFIFSSGFLKIAAEIRRYRSDFLCVIAEPEGNISLAGKQEGGDSNKPGLCS